MWQGNVGAVIGFELKRALSKGRMLWWAALAAFPVVITLLARIPEQAHGERIPREAWATIFFILCPMAVSMLGVFLYTAPAVAVELERKSWVYLAVRPNAPRAMLWGKYLVAVLWSITAALTGLTIAIILAQPERPFELWRGLSVLVLLSCPAYGAIYLLLGIVFYKRAMIVAIVYTLVFELAVGLIPAIINNLTIQFRLRALFMKFAEIDFPEQDTTVQQLFGNSPPVLHILVLLGYTAVLLGLSQLLLRLKEFTVADESTT